jgi:hypothetical protein
MKRISELKAGILGVLLLLLCFTILPADTEAQKSTTTTVYDMSAPVFEAPTFTVTKINTFAQDGVYQVQRWSPTTLNTTYLINVRETNISRFSPRETTWEAELIGLKPMRHELQSGPTARNGRHPLTYASVDDAGIDKWPARREIGFKLKKE